MANFNKKWSELSQAESQAMKQKFGSKQAWQDAKAKNEGFADEAERRGNVGAGEGKGTNYQAVQAVKKELKAETPQGSTAPTVAQMKNVRSSGSVTNERAQQYLNNRIQQAKQANQQAKTSRAATKKDDPDYRNVDELGYDTNTNDYGNKLNASVNKLTRYQKKLNKDNLTDEQRAKLEKKHANQSARRDELKDKMEAMRGFDGKDLSTYDYSGVGKNKFDSQDVAFLKSQGFSDQAITDYANGLDRSKVAGNAQVLEGYDIHRDNLIDADGNYDATVIGGSEGNNRFSGKDVRAMRAAGMSDEEIGKQLYDQQDDSTRSRKAQKLLDSYTSSLTDKYPIDDDKDPIDDDKDPIDDDDKEPIVDDYEPPVNDDYEPPVNDDYEPPVNDDYKPPVNDDPYEDYEPNPPGDNITDGPGSPIINDGPGDDTYEDIGIGNDDIEVIGDDNNVIGDNGIINEDFNNTNIDNSFNGPSVEGDVNVEGDGNTLDFSNNSRYFGGDNRVFNLNYGGGGNNSSGGQVFTPASDLTMMGAYDVNDTPASIAGFNDMFTTLNRDNQKRYADFGSNTAKKYINLARDAQPSEWDTINQGIGQSIYNHYENAHRMQTLMGGDPYAYKAKPFEFPVPQSGVDTSGIDEAYDDARDDLDDM